ncbi:sugar ABC transporter, partial [Vibrio cholerae]
MIELSNVNLHYPVPGHFSHSLQTTISSKIGGVLGSSSAKDKEMKYVHAL